MPPVRHPCGHCALVFPTASGVRRHIAHSRACYAQWEAQLSRPLFHGAQDGPVNLNDEPGPGFGDEDLPEYEPAAAANGEGNPEDAHQRAEDETIPRYAQVFDEKDVADIFGNAETTFDAMKAAQEAGGQGDYAPFADKEEWELAEWLIKNVNQRATEEFLKLGIVCSIHDKSVTGTHRDATQTRERTKPTFRNKNAFLKVVDQLPTGPEWRCELIRAHGEVEADGDVSDRDVEELELWIRDPVACVQELIGNPAFNGEIAYAPERVYTDIDGRSRRYDEMWTGDWWWEMQVSSS